MDDKIRECCDAFGKRDYKKVVELSQDLINCSELSGYMKNKIFSQIAYSLSVTGRIDEAYDLVKTFTFLPEWLNGELLIHFNAGKYQEAFDILRQKAPDPAITALEYAHAYLGLGKPDDALAMLKQWPNFNSPKHTMARILRICDDRNLVNFDRKTFFKKYFIDILGQGHRRRLDQSRRYSKEEKFYQYQVFSKYTWNNLENEVIYLGDFNTFNDPADPPFKLDRNHYAPFLEAAEGLRIACLTKDNDNLLMWAHYADKHQGICVEYDIKDFIAQEESHFSLYKVDYQESIGVNPVDKMLEASKGEQDGIDLIGMWAVKPADWEYENEYRLMRYFDKNNKDFTYSVKILAVYMGKDISSLDQKILEKLCKGKNITLFKMESAPSNLYKLSPKKIDNP